MDPVNIYYDHFNMSWGLCQCLEILLHCLVILLVCTGRPLAWSWTFTTPRRPVNMSWGVWTRLGTCPHVWDSVTMLWESQVYIEPLCMSRQTLPYLWSISDVYRSLLKRLGSLLTYLMSMLTCLGNLFTCLGLCNHAMRVSYCIYWATVYV
jgi:hypothetical protein